MTELSGLEQAIKGRLITRDDADYDDAREVFYGGFDSRPAAIVRVADSHDVARVVEFARVNDLELAVRSGGHSVVGYSTTEGGVLLDLRDMNALEIGADGRSAWAETGLTTGEVTAALQAHSRVVGFGDTASVGIGGITLGGGIGYLVRKHGLTVDSLLAVEVVTANGELVRADAENNPDLFWAIRGGGGNFGVATRFKYLLHELGPVVGGFLVLPVNPGVIAGFVAAAHEAPEDLSAIVNIMPGFPAPFMPEELLGKLVLMAGIVWAGDPDAGDEAVAPFRELATPVADMLRVMPYSEMFPPDDGSSHPTAVSETMFVDSIDRDAAATIVRYLEESDASMRVAQLRVLGGAMARVPADATAFAHRSSRILVNIAAFYEGPADRAVRAAWVSEFARSLPTTDRGAYVNFLEDLGDEGIRRAYPRATRDRLAEVKNKYDPTNLFRRNLNIRPT